MTEDGPAGFWSYTHRDNDLEGGRIRRLADAISNEFEIITGEELKIFVDSQSITWGDLWRERIDSALSNITFLIPIITPAFFKSQECRREVITFMGNARSLGIEELLLPIYYVDVPQLSADPVADEVMAIIAQRQREDWRDLRLEAEDSPKFRKAINKLALRLSALIESVEPSIVDLSAPVQTDADDDDEPGFVDLMADAEEAMPRWVATIERLSEITEQISAEMNQSTLHVHESDAIGGGFAGRVRIARDLAVRLQVPAQEMTQLGDQYSAELLRVDPAVIQILRRAAEGDESEGVVEWVSGLKGVIKSTRENVTVMEGFAASAREVARLSRDIKPVMKEVESAVQKIIDGWTVIEEWAHILDGFEGQ